MTGEEAPGARLLDAFRAVQTERDAEARALQPSQSIEALILRIIGGWEKLVAEVNFTRFHAAGADAGPLDRERLAKAVRDVADAARVRWPHEQFADAAAKAKFARDLLAHMLYISSVTGEYPNRCINIVRLGVPGAPRKGADGNPAELEWRDDAWSSQARHALPISEQSLIEALAGIRWMLDCLRGLLRIRDILADESADLPDDKVIDPFLWQVNWWHPSWGEPGSTELTVGHVRLGDSGTN